MNAPVLAVVGVGHMGTFHAQKLSQLSNEGIVEFAGVFDCDAKRAREVGLRLGVSSLASIEEVAARAQAAVVAVPTGQHAPVSAELLERGLDVLVEKPIATSSEEALSLVEYARQAGRILQIGHVERFSRAFREIVPVLDRPRFIEAHRIGPYAGRATDVSVVLDLMIHDLDIVAELAGAEVDRVEAVGVPVLSNTVDIANARLHFANGCVLNLTASRVSADSMRKIRIFQANAYISIDFGTNKIGVMRREGELDGSVPPKIRGETLEFDPGDALLEQDRAFARAVAERTPPVVSGEDGARALALALRIEASIAPLEETD